MRESAAVLTADLPGSSLTRAQSTSPATGTEGLLAELLAEIVGAEQVSVDSHFFDDLGADSLVMARFCARVRKRPELPSVSMKDIYAHPTIRSLATTLEEIAPSPVESSVPAWIEPARPAGTVSVRRLWSAAVAVLRRVRVLCRTGRRARLRVDLRGLGCC